MQTNTFDEVQAVLLNSEKDPGEEVQAALNAVAFFACLECEMTREGFLQMADEAWKKAAEQEAEEEAAVTSSGEP